MNLTAIHEEKLKHQAMYELLDDIETNAKQFGEFKECDTLQELYLTRYAALKADFIRVSVEGVELPVISPTLSRYEPENTLSITAHDEIRIDVPHDKRKYEIIGNNHF